MLPETTIEFLSWTWEQIAPYFHDLESRPLDATTLDNWMSDWARLGKHLDEAYWRCWVATTLDTQDEAVQTQFETFLSTIHEPAQSAEFRLKQKLLASGLQPPDFAAPLRNLHAEVALFRTVNLPLLTEEHRLGNQYDQIRSLQTVMWQGEETTLVQLDLVNHEPDRAQREAAWRLGAARFLEDRPALDALWTDLTDLRRTIAHNADLPNYRDYRWQQMLRLDYTPDDCETFHNAIEQVVVPAAERVLERRRQRLGLDSMRPWDVLVEPFGHPPLRPFQTVDELENKAEAIFTQLDPQLGQYFATMRRENLLDLDNRKGKMPSSYCATYPVLRRPFMFMNVVGSNEDLMILFHECGHAFHSFEMTHWPHHDQLRVGTEFHEVAATAMELLVAPHLDAFYNPADAARARIEHLEGMLRFWPYIAVVDAFQHWAHMHPQEARIPANCDAHWAGLWSRFMVGEDWSGLDDAMMTGWHRKLHIFRSPFYYIDYGLAQLGAVQIWAQALQDPALALKRYRDALALGATVTLPALFKAAEAKLVFDAEALGEAVNLIERTISELVSEI